MFKQLTDFSYKRTGKEAFGFYLAYFFLALLIGAILGALLSTSAKAQTFQAGYSAVLDSPVIPIITILYVEIIAVLVLVKRKLYKKFRYVILAIVSGLLAIFGGAILGLLLPAFMTTREVTSHE